VSWLRSRGHADGAKLLEIHVASMAGGSARESGNAEISGLVQQHEILV
jgi:hypothetical protein